MKIDMTRLLGFRLTGTDEATALSAKAGTKAGSKGGGDKISN
jgi:hypothetical protein